MQIFHVCFRSLLVLCIRAILGISRERTNVIKAENVNPINRRARRHPRNRAVLARGSHLQETFSLQVAQWRERAQEEQHKAERSVAG